MKLMIVSDLHLEFEFKHLDTLDADVLVIAGDLGVIHTHSDLMDIFFDNIQIPVVFVPGNHELYHGSMYDEYKHDNVVVLNNDLVTIDGVIFAGTTYWTNPVDKVKQQINDFRLITDIDTQELQHESASFLAETFVADVIITHFAPSYRSCDLCYVGSNLNTYFMNDNENMVGLHGEKFWIHGHNHNSSNYILNGVNVIANPKGYYNENSNYNPELIVEI